MAGIQFRHLSMEEAERCIAEVWTCLEEYQFSSPKISFDRKEASSVSFTVYFDDPLATSTLLTRLSNPAGVSDDLFRLLPERPIPTYAPSARADDASLLPLGLFLVMSALA